MPATADANALGRYLRVRRALVRPDAAGVPGQGDRRVPGLRREEVAFLAGVSSDYYVRLEQGRDRHPSDQVLLAIAQALQLDEDATAYLLQLAQPPRPLTKCTRRPEKVSDSIRTLISSWPLTPAYVHDTCTHILAANTLATALCPFITPGRNAILDAFTEPEMRELRPDWDVMTARAVPHLRSITGAETGDPRLVELVGELSLRSERFRTLWARQDVKHNTTGASLFNHPQVGPLELNYERLLIAGSGMLALVTYHAQPGSDSEERLRLLDSITTTGPATPVRPRPARPRQPRTTSQRDGIPGRHCYADTLHASSPAGAPAPGERLRALRPRRATTDNQRQPNSGLE